MLMLLHKFSLNVQETNTRDWVIFSRVILAPTSTNTPYSDVVIVVVIRKRMKKKEE